MSRTMPVHFRNFLNTNPTLAELGLSPQGNLPVCADRTRAKARNNSSALRVSEFVQCRRTGDGWILATQIKTGRVEITRPAVIERDKTR